MKCKLCCAPAQRGAGRAEGAGGEPVPNPDFPHAALSPRAKAHAPLPIQLLSHAYGGGAGVGGISAHVRLLTVRPSQKNTGSGGLVHVSDGSRTDWLPPPLGASAQAHLHADHLQTPTFSRRTHPSPIGPSAHARPRANGASVLFCACATVIPHSSPHPPPDWS